MRKKHPDKKKIMIYPQIGNHFYNYNVYNQYNKYNNTYFQSKKKFLIFKIDDFDDMSNEHTNDSKSILRNLIYIYSKFLNKKKKYYFFKFHSKVVKNINLKLCTCQHSTFENDYDSIYNIYPNTYRYKNFSTSTEYTKLNNKIANVKIQDFIINKENSNSYSNYINLNKSEYFFNGNEIGSFSSYNTNSNKNPSKNIISVKNGSNNKKYVVKIKLYGGQINTDDKDNNSIKYKKYTNNVNKSKKYTKNHYTYKNETMPYDMDHNSNCFYFNNKNIKLNKFHVPLTERVYHKDCVRTLNPTIKINQHENDSNNNNNNKVMEDQEILDYLNTNDSEKKNLIKKILNQKLGNNKQRIELKKLGNRKIMHLNNSKSYSYINNNYNYFYDRQITPSYNNRNKVINSYKYNNNTKIQRIVINKEHSLRPCNSNEILTYKEYTKEPKEKNLKKVKSYNNIQNLHINNNKINKNSQKNKINKIKNISNPGPRIILLNNKTRLKNSESTNKISSLKQKEKKKQKSMIPKCFNHKKMNSLGINTNIDEIDDNKNKIFMINKTVNEQFNKNKEELNYEKEKLEISVQSMNDSKMMELARNYIKQDDSLNLQEVHRILNCKKGWA